MKHLKILMIKLDCILFTQKIVILFERLRIYSKKIKLINLWKLTKISNYREN